MSSTSSVIGAPKVDEWLNQSEDLGSALWTNSKLKDCQIVIGDKVLGVHKCVLASRSSVFATMLTSELTSETQSGQLDIQDFDYGTVEIAIKYCYCDCLILGRNVSSFWNVLKFGHKYDLQHLVRACLHLIKICRRSYAPSERNFIIKSAFDLECNEILGPILDIFGVMSGELVPGSCPYTALGYALAKEEYFKKLKIICDLDGTEFSVHKCILALRSPVFAQIFEKMTKNGDTSGRLTINKMKPMIVQKAVEFLYIGYITITDTTDEAFENNSDLFLGLLKFADKFQVDQLVSFCLQKIDQSKNNLDKNTYIQTSANFESKKIFQFIREIFGTPGFYPFDFKKASNESYWD